jgi:Tol biopolymer transport system component
MLMRAAGITRKDHEPLGRAHDLLMVGMICSLLLCAGTASDVRAREVADIKLFKPGGDEVNWCRETNRIGYASRGPDNYYGIHTCSPRGDDDVWLTRDNPNVPPGHKGTPRWHPSGRYILFVAEKPRHPGMSFAATPGLGSYSDLWLMTADGKKAWQLTNIPETQDDGIIIPFFSYDGKHIAWAQRIERPKLFNPKQICGFWDIKVADFLDDGDNPRLVNITTFRPGGIPAFNEAYGFAPDGRSMIFCSDFNQKSFWSSQIFTCDARTGQNIRQLTDDAYNEHATYSPDGKHIVWMTSKGEWKGTDWWMMNADGSGKRQLTFFNKAGHPEYAGGNRMTCGLALFSPDGRQLVGGVQTSLILQKGDSYMITLH